MRRGRARLTSAVLLVAGAILAGGSGAQAATPPQGTLTPDAHGHGKLTWTGQMGAGTAENGTTDDCFDSADKPDPLSGCDFFRLTVNTPSGFYNRFLGGVRIFVGGFAPFDLDMAIYRLKANGAHGMQAGSSGNATNTVIGTDVCPGAKASAAFVGT